MAVNIGEGVAVTDRMLAQWQRGRDQRFVLRGLDIYVPKYGTPAFMSAEARAEAAARVERLKETL